MRILGVIIVALAIAGVAAATAPPVKVVPAGPLSTIVTKQGELVSFALPRKAGYSWRLARNSAPGVVRQVSEGNVGASVVVVFKAVTRGRATVVYAATRGESTTAVSARTYVVAVR
jgi:hypothetical protein